MPTTVDLVEGLARLALFADVDRPELEAIAHEYGDELFADGQRVIRTGLTGNAVFIVIEGEAVVRRGDHELSRVGPGQILGELSALLREPPSADVVAHGLLRCLVIPAPEIETFLLERPRVMLRVLKDVGQRLRGMLEGME